MVWVIVSKLYSIEHPRSSVVVAHWCAPSFSQATPLELLRMRHLNHDDSYHSRSFGGAHKASCSSEENHVPTAATSEGSSEPWKDWG